MTLASDARAIARAGVREVDPARAVARAVRSRGDSLYLDGLRVEGARPGRVRLVAVGKAASAMYDSAHRALGRFSGGGWAVVHEGYAPPRAPARVLFGEHPVPGAGSFAAGSALLAFVGGLTPDDTLLFLISGGGSALAEAPQPGVDPEDVAEATRTLLASGAPIQSMNAIRRHLSAIKGGRLAAASAAGRSVTLALSDVVGDRPCEIASGPTVPDPTTYRDAEQAVERYRLKERLPASIVRHLREGASGRVPETPKEGDPRLARGRFHLVATNRVAVEAALREARRRGYRSEILSSEIVGETRDVARVLGALLAEVARTAPPSRRCLLSGGETTVTLGPGAGRGGRNQEFALAIAPVIDGLPGAYALSIGTDGIDGPTDAAGGAVDGRTMARARALGRDVEAALERHAAYDALEALGGLVRTGPTGTNVMDLHVLLCARPATSSTGGSSRRGGVRASRRRRS